MSKYMHDNDRLKHLIFWNGGSSIQELRHANTPRRPCTAAGYYHPVSEETDRGLEFLK
jgi:hypothetical protein